MAADETREPDDKKPYVSPEDLERLGSELSLREEIAIARMTLEAVVNTARDEHDLAEKAGIVIALVDKIEELVWSVDKLERLKARRRKEEE